MTAKNRNPWREYAIINKTEYASANANVILILINSSIVVYYSNLSTLQMK